MRAQNPAQRPRFPACNAAVVRNTELPLTSALLPRWHRAAAGGHAEDDLAAVCTTLTPRGEPTTVILGRTPDTDGSRLREEGTRS